MRRLIFQEYVTVDGFAAGPNGELDFFETVRDDSPDEENLRLLETVDTMLLGATTYRLFAGFWPTADGEPLAPALNGLRKVVVSSTLDSAPWGDWEAGRVLHGDAAEAVADLKRQDGKNIILWGSISLFHTLLLAGLVDEVQLRVCPVVLGEGLPVFPTGTKVDLELIEAGPWARGGARLRYQPVARGAEAEG